MRTYEEYCKLDEEVADEVLGYFLIKDWVPDTLPPGCVLAWDAWQEFWHKHKDSDMRTKDLMKAKVGDYSTCMRSAQEVIERMTVLGYGYEAKSSNEKHAWRFVKDGTEEWFETDKMSEALCESALAIVRGAKGSST